MSKKQLEPVKVNITSIYAKHCRIDLTEGDLHYQLITPKLVVNNLAVTNQPSGKDSDKKKRHYTVTHIPSGLAVVPTGYKLWEAKALCELLGNSPKFVSLCDALHANPKADPKDYPGALNLRAEAVRVMNSGPKNGALFTELVNNSLQQS